MRARRKLKATQKQKFETAPDFGGTASHELKSTLPKYADAFDVVLTFFPLCLGDL